MLMHRESLWQPRGKAWKYCPLHTEDRKPTCGGIGGRKTGKTSYVLASKYLRVYLGIKELVKNSKIVV